MDYTTKLTCDEVVADVCATLNDYLPLTTSDVACSGEELWEIVAGAAAKKTTMNGICQDLQDAPSGALVRQYLNAHFRVEDLKDIERRFNAALVSRVPNRVFKARRDTAIDGHDQSYYGKTTQEEGLWVRGEAKDGTTRFYRVATAYVIWQDIRVTLAIRFVLPDDEQADVVADLLDTLESVKYRVKTLFMDRGFGSVKIMQLMEERGIRALIACTIRGKTGGTRQLCRGPHSYTTPYTFNAENGAYTAKLAICRVPMPHRRKRRVDWLIFIMIGCNMNPKDARNAYRKRFGIESSYRCSRQARAWTTSPNPMLRFVFIAVSFFLVNLWIAIRWFIAQVPLRDDRTVNDAYFRLAHLLRWISTVVDHDFQPMNYRFALTKPVV